MVFEGLEKEYDLIVNVSPGSTKSTIASIMYPPWIWTIMPSARFIGGSYAKDLSMDLSRRSRDIVKSDKYKRAFPYIKLRGDQDVKSYFANTKGGGRFACGTGGAVVGFHAHFIVIDDPLNPNEALSDVELANTNAWMNDTLSQRKIDKNITPTILIMQRLHQNDPSAHMLKVAKEAQQIEIKEGNIHAPLRIKHICMPAELTKDVKPSFLRKYYKDGLMDPVRLPPKVLNENKARGQYLYSGQFLQDPVPLGGGMFKTDRITIEAALPAHIQWKARWRFWDKAGTLDAGAYTAGVELGLDTDGRFWIIHVIRGQWDSAQREIIIKQTAIMDGYKVFIGVEQEPGSAGKESAENTIKNLAGFVVRAERPTGDKAVRADPFSAQVNIRNVFMVAGNWNTAYIDELRYFPLSTYKDQVDASSGAFKMLTKGSRIVGALPRHGQGRRRR